MDFTPDGTPVLEISRSDAINYLASALHNYTVAGAAQLIPLLGMEAGAEIARLSAANDMAALLALGITREELAEAEITHAH